MTRDRLFGYPETIRICSTHSKPSCQDCLDRSLDSSAGVSRILFHNPVKKIEVYE